jgi:hypothetical protein
VYKRQDIDIIELPHDMTKEESVAYLLSIDFDNGNVDVREALESAARKRKLPGFEAPKKTPAVADEITDEEAAAIEAEIQANSVVTELVVAEDNVIELPAAAAPAKELSMTPDAIRKREARARSKTEEQMIAWAAAADAEDAAEAEADDAAAA